MQMSTLTAVLISTALAFSHKTISHQAAAAPGPEVHRECPMT